MTWRILNSIESIAQPLVNNMIAVWVFLFHVLVIGSSRGKNVKLGYSTDFGESLPFCNSEREEVWQTLHGCGCSQPKLLYCCNIRKVYNLCLRSPQVRKNCVSVCVCMCGQKSTPGCLVTYRTKRKTILSVYYLLVKYKCLRSVFFFTSSKLYRRSNLYLFYLDRPCMEYCISYGFPCLIMQQFGEGRVQCSYRYMCSSPLTVRSVRTVYIFSGTLVIYMHTYHGHSQWARWYYRYRLMV